MQVIKNILLTLSQGLGKIKPALQHRTPAVQESSSGRLGIYNFTEAFHIVFDLRSIHLYIFENEIPPPPFLNLIHIFTRCSKRPFFNAEIKVINEYYK